MHSTVNIYISQKTHEFGNAALHNAPACRRNFGLRDPVCSLLTNWIVGEREKLIVAKVQLKKRGTYRIGVISLPEVGKPRPVNPAKRAGVRFVFLASTQRLLQGKTPLHQPWSSASEILPESFSIS
jgi:hypothetical protein